MFKRMYIKLLNKLIAWLSYEPPTHEIMPYDFNRLKHEIRPGDVLLIEGRSRISSVIRTLTQSPWTHAALYIGRLNDYEDEEIQAEIRKHTKAKDNTRLIYEDLIDTKGAVINPLSSYQHHHIRICRPIGIAPADTQLVIEYAIKTLGHPYSIKHLLDLARFLLPWSILPRRWGSSLFKVKKDDPASGICSSLIAQAFASVQFPILPFIKPHEKDGVEVFQRNPHLFSPKDFDYSPYFAIIKYPLFNPDEPLPYYRRMPWTKTGWLHHDQGVLSELQEEKPKKKINKDKDTPPS